MNVFSYRNRLIHTLPVLDQRSSNTTSIVIFVESSKS